MDAAACVLRDHSLMAYVASFQRGLPLVFYQILQTQRTKERKYYPTMNYLPSHLWRGVLLHGDLGLVQRLYAMKFLAEYESVWQVQRIDIPFGAAICGRVDVLQWFDAAPEASEAPWNSELLYQAVHAKRFNCARWLLAHRPLTCVRSIYLSMAAAIQAKDFDLFMKMLEFQPDAATCQVTTCAVASGNMEIVLSLHNLEGRRARSFFPLWRNIHMDTAAAEGHLHIVKFLHTNRTEGCTWNAMNLAATNGHLNVVRFLHENRDEGCTTDAMDGAASSGHHEIVQFLIENRNEGCTEVAIARAAENDDFELLVLLHEAYGVNVTRDWGLISKAFRKNRMDIAHYLRDVVRVRFVKRELNDAITTGNLELVQFLHQNRPERSTDEAITLAGASSHAPIIDYLLEHREEPVSQRTFDVAVGSVRVALVKRLHEKFGLTTSFMPCSSYKWDGDFVKYLHEVVGVPLPSLEQVVPVGSLKCVQYVWEKEGGDLAAAIELAKRKKRDATVQFLQAQTPIEEKGRRLRRRTCRRTSRVEPY